MNFVDVDKSSSTKPFPPPEMALGKCWRPYLGSPIGTVIVTRYMVFECACIYFHCDLTLDIT